MIRATSSSNFQPHTHRRLIDLMRGGGGLELFWIDEKLFIHLLDHIFLNYTNKKGTSTIMEINTDKN